MNEKVGRLGFTFQSLLGSSTSPEGNTRLRYKASDGRQYELDLAPQCLALTIVDLSKHLANVPSDDLQQRISISSVEGAVADDGAPVLLFNMEGGGSLPLRLEKGSVSDLIGILTKLQPPAGDSRH